MRGAGNGSRNPTELGDVNWSSLKQLIPYLTEFKGRIAIAVLCLIAAKVASVGLPFILKRIVDQLNAGEALAVVVPIALLLAYGLVRFSNVLFGELRDTLFGRVTERTIRRIGLQTFKHLHNLDLDFHLNRRTGGLSRDIERGTTGINMLMRFLVFNIFPTLFEVLLVVGLLFYNYGLSFALIILVSVVAYVAYSVVATDWRTRFVREVNVADSASNSRAIDSLLNYETVKYFTNEDYESNRYDKNLATWEQAKRKNRLTMFALNGGQAFIIAAATTSMLALAALRVADGTMTIGDFVLINAFMMQIFIPLNFLGFVYREIKGSLANIEQMFDLLEKKPKIEDSKKARKLDAGSTEVAFNNVSFHYHPERPIIKDISFTVKEGESLRATLGDPDKAPAEKQAVLKAFIDQKTRDLEALANRTGNAVPKTTDKPAKRLKFNSATGRLE